MIKFIFYILILSLSYERSFANSNKPIKIGTEIRASQILATTQYGDKKSDFKLSWIQNNSIISLNTSYGEKSQRKVSNKGIAFIFTEFDKLKLPKHIPKECYRSKVEIKKIDNDGKIITKSSCFGVRTITSKQYAKFINLLVSAL
jgi:hypothetical protein